MNLLKSLFVYSVLFFSWTFLQGQSRSYEIKDLLAFIQEKFDVSFSYADKVVEGITIELEPAIDQDLSAILKSIESRVPITFEELETGQYVISSAENVMLSFTLLDQQSNLPIQGALVYSNLFAVSDASGKVDLRSSPGKPLNIQHIGYKTVQLKQTELSDSIYLTASSQMLEELSIYNYLSDGIYKSVDGSIVLGVDPVRMLPGMTEPDVLQSLKFLPGVQSVSESLSEINIRGGTPDQNLLLFNDVRVYQPGHFFGLISVFNPQYVANARLVKDGTSVRYGDAASGVIALTSKDEIPEQTQVTVGASLLNVDAKVTAPMGSKGAFTLSGRRSIGDWVNTPTYRSYFDRSFAQTDVGQLNSSNDSSMSSSNQRFYFSDILLQYNQRLADSRNSLKIFGLWIANDLSFTESALLNGVNQTLNSSLGQSSLLGCAELVKWWRGNFNSRFLASYSQYDLEGRNSDVVNDLVLTQENQVVDFQIKWENRWKASENFDLLFGYQGNNIGDLNSNELNNPAIREEFKRVLTNHVFFGEIYTLFKGIDIQAGLRNVIFYEPKRISIEPRLRAFKKLSRLVGLEITGEVKSQSMFHKVDLQTDFLGIEKRRWFLEENDLFRPVSARQITAGLLYNEKRLLLDGKFYLKEVKEISTISQDFVNQFSQIKENGSYSVHGLDLLINYRWKEWNSWGSYTYMNNRFHFPALVPPSFLNNTNIPHNLSAGISYKNNSWDFSTGINWHIGRPYTGVKADSVINNTISFASPNADRLPNYFRWDFSGQYKKQFKHQRMGVVGLSIWNITNRENVISRFYRLSEEFSLQRVDRPSLPVTINFVFRLWF